MFYLRFGNKCNKYQGVNFTRWLAHLGWTFSPLVGHSHLMWGISNSHSYFHLALAFSTHMGYFHFMWTFYFVKGIFTSCGHFHLTFPFCIVTSTLCGPVPSCIGHFCLTWEFPTHIRPFYLTWSIFTLHGHFHLAWPLPKSHLIWPSHLVYHRMCTHLPCFPPCENNIVHLVCKNSQKNSQSNPNSINKEPLRTTKKSHDNLYMAN